MGLFNDIFEGAIDLATAPIEVAKDIVTLGGTVNGQDKSYTQKRLLKLKDDAENVIDDL